MTICRTPLVIAKTYTKAIDYFQQAVTAHPLQVQPYLHLAQSYLELGETEKCFQLFEKAIEKLGNKAEIYHKKAHVFWMIRKIDTALTTQDEGLELFPDNYALQIQNIHFLINLGQYDDARKKIELLPTNDFNQQLIIKLFSAQINKGQWRINEATRQYDAILKLYPVCYEAQHARLLIALVSMDIETAKKYSYLLCQHNIGTQKIKGQKRKYLHDHYAQFINEYALNQGILHQVQEALNLPITQRLDRLALIIIDEPETTSASVSFLAQLRITNYFGQQKCSGKQVIPKNIFQYWDKSNPSQEVLNFTKSWQELNPDYQYQLYDEIKARLFLQQYYPKNILKNYLRSTHVAQKADILRLALLLEFGGVYADADDLCLRPLHAFIPDDTHLLLWQEVYASVGNNFIAVTPGHPVIKTAFDQAIEAMERGDKDSIWLSTGPGLLSRSLAFYLARHWPHQSPQDLKVAILNNAEMLNRVGIHGKLAYKTTKKSWTTQEFEKATAFI